MSDWEIFDHMIVRPTGFPWEMLDRLRYSKSADAERRLIWEEGELASYRSRAPRVHRPPKSVLSALRAGRPVDTSSLPEPELFAEWNRLAERVEQARRDVEACFLEDEAAAKEHLAAILADPRVLEAIASSSPPVFLDIQRGRWSARLDRQVGSYLQRLCAKNETMSFFGPINYGRLQPDAETGVECTWTGPRTLTGRQAYAASWLVNGLFRTIAFMPGVAPWLILRRKGFLKAPSRAKRRQRLGDILIAMGVLTPGQVREALGRQASDRRRFGELVLELGSCTQEELDRALAIQAGRVPMPEVREGQGDSEDLLPRLVEAADGVRSLGTLAHALEIDIVDATHFARVGCERGFLTHQLEIPPALHHPIDELFERLSGIPGEPVRKQLAALGRIRELMRSYSDADAGTKVELNERLRSYCEETWGIVPPDRTPAKAGSMREKRGEGHNFYADRLPIREECGGDLRVTVSGERARELGERISVPLEMMGYSAVRTRTAARRLVASLLGKRTIPFWKVAAAFSDRPIPASEEISASLTEAIDEPAAPEVHLDDVARQLRVDDASVPLIASIDLLVAADSVERWAAGDYQVILGDVHDTALVWGWALQFHPQRRVVESELLQQVGLLERNVPLVTALPSRRTGLIPSEFPGPVIEIGGVSARSSGWRLPLDDLDVVSDGNDARLMSKSLRSEVCLYNGELESLVHTAFALPRIRSFSVDLGVHTPRLVINGVVLQRERWRLTEEQIERLCSCKTDRARMRAAISLWDELGMPEYVFAKLSGERKPVLVDVRSPLLLRVFSNLLEQKRSVLLTEMYPAPSQLWLSGAEGRHTAELRCTFYRTGPAHAAEQEPPA